MAADRYEGVLLTENATSRFFHQALAADVEIEVLLTYQDIITPRERRRLLRLDREVHAVLETILPYVADPELLVHDDRLDARMRRIEATIAEDWFWTMGARYGIESLTTRVTAPSGRATATP